MALLGVHPKFTLEPPRCSRSTTATDRPLSARARATGMPAWPPPMMTASTVTSVIVIRLLENEVLPGRCRGSNLSAPNLEEAVESEWTCSIGLRRRARVVEDTAQQRLPLRQVTYAWLELVGPEGRQRRSLLQEQLRASSHPQGGGSTHLLCRRWRRRRRLRGASSRRLGFQFASSLSPMLFVTAVRRPGLLPNLVSPIPDGFIVQHHGTLSNHALDQSWRAGRWQESYRPARRPIRTAESGWALNQLELTWPSEAPFCLARNAADRSRMLSGASFLTRRPPSDDAARPSNATVGGART